MCQYKQDILRES